MAEILRMRSHPIMKLPRVAFFIGALLFVLSLPWITGCATAPTTFDDPDMSIDVIVGNKFKITMRANPTTGYKWELAASLDETRVKLIGSEYKKNEPTRAGSGGAEVWSFLGVSEGKTSISFQYVRPWETNAAPARSETYMVNIRP